MPKLLEVRNLKTQFFTQDGVVHAVNGISYYVNAGETVAIVGESGSGKSVGVMSLIRLIPQPPGKIVDGEVIFDGQDLLKLSEDELRDQVLRRDRDDSLLVEFQTPAPGVVLLDNSNLTFDEAVAAVVALAQEARS